MRGKVAAEDVRLSRIRITPAYAGKSDDSIRKGFFQKDHPRLCGEKYAQKEFFYKNLGSPPPMRGKDGVKQYTADRVGITPAYAGKS